MKKLLGILSLIVGTLTYIHIIVTTIKGTGEGLSLTTFLLWSALAWISGFSMLKQGANPTIAFVYGTGGTILTAVLFCKGKASVSGFDIFIALLVVVCVVLWLYKGARYALLLSTTAGMLSALPFIVMTWQQPANSPIVTNAGFLLANILSFFAAKNWTVEERLYPVSNVIVCTLLVLPWFIG